ncbi:Stk1 family PASTA domain-containing Ser/Thr kinase [Flexivirga endophytica]|uniref:Stk1 family PASTA domain-containing Ser/Thr kinase n=1 Tax=Flexivirga endophytica TaxID=1849103 RepID=UPI001667A567|nr:Stk1 family PASTA domain-containing Ser/Thr kinase [Flexivirga endophytica]
MSISAPSLVGRTIDERYVVREHLADGGMGSVYVALDERLDREVALKIMRPDLARDADFVARFRREARSAARLTHPNVVAVTDQGSDEDYVFLAMELVRGQTLRQLIRRDAPLPVRQALEMMEGILRALDAAHQAGLVHRDVKPENVLIGAHGVKVADFGLARAVTTDTLTGDSDVLLGTAAYLSPEQVENGRADERSDVYSAGLLLFEMLTGEKAFPGDSPINVAYQHVHGTMPRPSEAVPTVPSAVDELVLRATAKNPDERPANAGAMLHELHLTRDRLGSGALDAPPRTQPADRGSCGVPDGCSGDPAKYSGERSGGETSWGGEHDTGPMAADSTQHFDRGGPPSAGRTGRRRWPWIAGILVVVLLIAGGLGAWAFTAGPLGKVTVPTVAGERQGRAVDAIQGAGLHARIQQVFSEKVARGVVVSASPHAGNDARKNSTVTLTVSKGPERYTVPSVVGRSEAAARNAIEKAHLRVGKVSHAYDEKVAEGKVARVDPSGGSAQKPKTTVDLVVSKGKRPIDIADVTGQPSADAKQTLTDAGFTVTFGPEQHSDTVAKGDVISQDPPNGTGHKGDAIQLVVSKGPVLVTVPKVIGMSSGAAKEKLEGLGFQVKTSYPLLVPVLFQVQGQSVKADTQAPKGSTITIDVV